MSACHDTSAALAEPGFAAGASIICHGFTEMEIVAPARLQFIGMQQSGSPSHGPVWTSVSQSNEKPARLKTADIPVSGSQTAATGLSSKIDPAAQF
jgi:hypothetical protein